jgi:hypothetical protein
MMMLLHQVCMFGSLVLPPESGCKALCQIFETMAKARMMGTNAKKRKEYITAGQSRLLRQAAHAIGYRSIALQQAIAFELGLRQKDVIGEWLPKASPGVSDIHWGPRKWLMGLRWEEIDAELILKHRLSKSVRGRNNLMDTDVGTLKAWDLKAHPMVMEELAQLCGGMVDRSKLPASGPLIMAPAARGRVRASGSSGAPLQRRLASRRIYRTGTVGRGRQRKRSMPELS